MRLLLIHQNFPGQFRQLAPHLEERGHELVAIASHQRPIALKGRVLRYQEPEALTGVPLGSQIWHEGLERAARVVGPAGLSVAPQVRGPVPPALSGIERRARQYPWHTSR